MQPNSNRDCAYESNGQHCRYPGAVSHGILGGGPWYCRIHIRDGGNAIARQALDHSQHYRQPLPPEDDLKALTWLTAHFQMLPRETRPAYNLRCRAKSMGKRFEPKRIVNSEPIRMREPGEDLEEF